jgi:hypothetical protein
MGLPSVSSWTVTLPMTFTVAARGKNRSRVPVGISEALSRLAKVRMNDAIEFRRDN